MSEQSETHKTLVSTIDRACEIHGLATYSELLSALRRASLALAFAAESSPAMKDDYNAVSAAISRATGES